MTDLARPIGGDTVEALLEFGSHIFAGILDLRRGSCDQKRRAHHPLPTFRAHETYIFNLVRKLKLMETAQSTSLPLFPYFLKIHLTTPYPLISMSVWAMLYPRIRRHIWIF